MPVSTPERPLSPHLTVYKWAYTMTLSILHRVSGVALALALIFFVAWLGAAAAGAAAYQQVMGWLILAPAKLVVALALLALLFHLCNGVRHLAWDAGFGFERRDARRSAWIVIVLTVLGAALCGWVLWHAWGAG